MTPELAADVVPVFLAEIRKKLQGALASATAAEAYAKDGGIDGAVQIALDIEVLTYEAKLLLDAASLVNRLAGEAMGGGGQ
jgi:hypothetical protein